MADEKEEQTSDDGSVTVDEPTEPVLDPKDDDLGKEAPESGD
jgi:hypothetical protein